MSAVAHVKPGNGELVATRVEERSEGGRVAYVTVTNEAKYNALPAEGRRAIGEAMKTLSHDPDPPEEPAELRDALAAAAQPVVHCLSCCGLGWHREFRS